MKTETDVRTLATPVSPQQSFSCSKFEAPGRAMQMRTKKQISFGRNRNSKRTSCSALMKSLNFTYSDELNRFWLIRSIAWCQSRHYSAKDCVDRAKNVKTFSILYVHSGFRIGMETNPSEISAAEHPSVDVNDKIRVTPYTYRIIHKMKPIAMRFVSLIAMDEYWVWVLS